MICHSTTRWVARASLAILLTGLLGCAAARSFLVNFSACAAPEIASSVAGAVAHLLGRLISNGGPGTATEWRQLGQDVARTHGVAVAQCAINKAIEELSKHPDGSTAPTNTPGTPGLNRMLFQKVDPLEAQLRRDRAMYGLMWLSRHQDEWQMAALIGRP